MSRILWALGVLLCVAPMATGQTVGDDFNDNVVNPTTWGADSVEGQGALAEINQRLEFTVGAASATAGPAGQRPARAQRRGALLGRRVRRRDQERRGTVQGEVRVMRPVRAPSP